MQLEHIMNGYFDVYSVSKSNADPLAVGDGMRKNCFA